MINKVVKICFLVVLSSLFACSMEVKVPSDVLDPLSVSEQQIKKQCEGLYPFYEVLHYYCSEDGGVTEFSDNCALIVDYEDYCKNYSPNLSAPDKD